MHTLAERFLEQPWVYRAWQAPFADQKFAPILAHNDLARVESVLDIGCGPGTNAKYFINSEYLGIDVNPSYIEHARRRHGREFIAADVRTYRPNSDRRFDFILINSFLHHLNCDAVKRILTRVSTLLADGGSLHILELVMPGNRSVARLLARIDRGNFVRSQEEWRILFTSHFEPVWFQPYRLTTAGLTLWNMVYFRGRARR
ncbi:MAG: class I SAM-dependent methyltransferase [Acidobacteria bacterium]|nr:class I SAM-dependent methyltransferase [Acidobacteriota bacterium]